MDGATVAVEFHGAFGGRNGHVPRLITRFWKPQDALLDAIPDTSGELTGALPYVARSSTLSLIPVGLLPLLAMSWSTFRYYPCAVHAVRCMSSRRLSRDSAIPDFFAAKPATRRALYWGNFVAPQCAERRTPPPALAANTVTAAGEICTKIA